MSKQLKANLLHALFVGIICGVLVGVYAALPIETPLYWAAFIMIPTVFMFGVYYGITNVMMPPFTRASFGDAEYARIYSRVSMVASISNATGAFVWGTVVSVSGSYVAMFGGAILLMAITCAIVVAIGRAQRA